jgi:DNA-binding transcriptional ArsR family regulator
MIEARAQTKRFVCSILLPHMGSTDQTDALLAALCHPLRRRILRLMPEGGDESISPRDLALQLDEELTRVSYHVRVLAACGVAKQVGKRRIKRAWVQHFYRREVKAKWAREILARPEPDFLGRNR